MPLGDFTAQARDYAASRPGYPDALLDRLLRHAGVTPGDPVADLGAGTGLSTAQLTARGLRVLAVEPNAAMRDAAPDLANVTWVRGTFEHTTLPDASLAWCLAAQSMHWADLPRALPELRRVLRPSAALTCLWNDRTPTPGSVLAAVTELIRQHVPGFDEAYRQRDWAAELTATGDFLNPQTDEATHTVAMPRGRFLALWRGHNRLNTTAGPERARALHRAIAEHLDHAGLDTVDVPYTCRAYTVSRA